MTVASAPTFGALTAPRVPCGGEAMRRVDGRSMSALRGHRPIRREGRRGRMRSRIVVLVQAPGQPETRGRQPRRRSTRGSPSRPVETERVHASPKDPTHRGADVVSLARGAAGSALPTSPPQDHTHRSDSWHRAVRHQPTRRSGPRRSDTGRMAQSSADLSRALLRIEPGHPHRITAPNVTASRAVGGHAAFRGAGSAIPKHVLTHAEAS